MINRKAVTLIELVITVVVLAILISIAVPVYKDAIIRNRVKEIYSNLRLIYAAQKKHALMNNGNFAIGGTTPAHIFTELGIEVEEPVGGVNYSIGPNPGVLLGQAQVTINSTLYTFRVKDTANASPPADPGEPYCVNLGCPY